MSPTQPIVSVGSGASCRPRPGISYNSSSGGSRRRSKYTW
jgi:hypothetical protein